MPFHQGTFHACTTSRPRIAKNTWTYHCVALGSRYLWWASSPETMTYSNCSACTKSEKEELGWEEKKGRKAGQGGVKKICISPEFDENDINQFVCKGGARKYDCHHVIRSRSCVSRLLMHAWFQLLGTLSWKKHISCKKEANTIILWPVNAGHDNWSNSRLSACIFDGYVHANKPKQKFCTKKGKNAHCFKHTSPSHAATLTPMIDLDRSHRIQQHWHKKVRKLPSPSCAMLTFVISPFFLYPPSWVPLRRHTITDTHANTIILSPINSAHPNLLETCQAAWPTCKYTHSYGPKQKKMD